MTTSSLSLGSLSTTSGVARLTGTSSNIDTDAIIQAAYDAATRPAARLQQKITTDQAKTAAYGDLRTLLAGLQSAVDGLRSPPGVLGVESNVFEKKEAYLSSDGSTAPGQLLGVAVDNRAAVGSFAITVQQLATADKLAAASVGGADTSLADAWNGGAGFTGTLGIGLEGGGSAAVAIDGSMGVYDLAAAINGVSGQSGVAASVLRVSATDYRLVLTGKVTGKAITLDDGGSGAAGRMGLGEIQAAAKARLTVDGVDVERDGNDITDLVPGVTVSLYQADPGTTIAVDVQPSLTGIKTQIQSLVDAYNAFRDFVAKQSTVDSSGRVGQDAVLFGDRTIRTLTQTLGGIVGGPAAGLSSDAMSTLRAIGISMGDGGKLALDPSTLDQSLLGNLDAVRGVLAFGFASSSPQLAVYNRTNALTDNTFDVAITDADGDGVPESVTLDGVPAELDGTTIKGASGTPYDGLELLWTGKGSTTVHVQTSQGIADQLYNALDTALDGRTGLVQQAIDGLGQADEGYTKQIATINDRADAQRALLIQRFTAMEAALTIANTMLAQIEAQMSASSAKS
jgi:flagellar hook-associated protein 2